MSQEEKKGINLMPEDLRSKESSLLSKVKTKNDFDFDFVSPDKNSSASKKLKGGPSFWENLKSAFQKAPRFGQSLDKPKKEKPKKDKKHKHQEHKENKDENKAPAKVELYVPEKLKAKDSVQIDYNNKKPEAAQDENKDNLGKLDLPVVKEEEKQSFWDKLKSMFSFKKKGPKVERKEEKAVAAMPDFKMASDAIKDNQKELVKEVPKPVESLPQDIFDQQNNKVDDTIAEQPQMTKLEDKEVSPDKPADFSIPAWDFQKSEDIKPVGKTPEPIVEEEGAKAGTIKQKFHQPSPRIRARLLENGGGVDLIPTAARTRSWKQISTLLFITLLFSVAIVGIFYGFLYYQEKQVLAQQANKDQQISDLERQILTYEGLNKDISTLGEEIKSVHKLISFHFYWTNFFRLLEKYTIEEVQYTGLTAGNGGALTLSAYTDSYDAVARQIKVLQQEEAREFVLDVSVFGATNSEGSDLVEFDMTLVLNPMLFVYDSEYNNIIDQVDNEEGDNDL